MPCWFTPTLYASCMYVSFSLRYSSRAYGQVLSAGSRWGSCGGAGEGLAAEVLTRASAQIAKLDGHPPRPFPPVGTGGWAPGERVGLQALRARLAGCTGEIRPQVPDALTGDMLVRTCTCSHLHLSSHTCPGMFSQHPGTDTHFLTCMCMFLQ